MESAGLFLAGISGFWLGALAVLALLFIAILFATGNRFIGSAAIVGAFIVSQYTAFPLITLALINWYTLLIYGGVYLGVGFVWSVFAYIFRLLRVRNQYAHDRKEYLQQFLKENNLTELKDADVPKWRDWLESTALYRRYEEKTRMTTSYFIGTAVFWPVSIFEATIKDIVVVVFTAIYKRLGNFFSNIRRWIFRDFVELQ